VKKSWYEHLEALDRRIIYLVVFICLIIPNFVRFKLPLPMDTGTKMLCASIDKLASDNQKAEREGKKKKIALVVADWDASTQAECWPQTVAVMTYLYQKKIPFATVSFFPAGPQFIKYCIENIQNMDNGISADGEFVDYKKITYGTDYCEWGYKLADLSVYLGIAANLYGIVTADGYGTPIREVPMMKDVASLHDVGFVFQCSGTGIIGYWISYIRPKVNFDLASGVTAIMGPSMTPYLQSGQLCGLLIGMSGAYMLEQHIKIEQLGSIGMEGQNFAHVWIILAMVLGNVGFVLMRRKKARIEKEQRL
jgi:hypothetical protein